MQEIVVALAGNPNAGKTTVFNALTGSRQHVGNYPGVTVEKKEGIVESGGKRFRIIDLPGTYSLSAASPEEVVARQFLVDEQPDVVVQVVDATNLERNLYLTTQLMELGVRLVLAFNMSDIAKEKGYEFDVAALSEQLQAPVVATVGNRKHGMDALLSAVAETADKAVPVYNRLRYPAELEQAIDRIDAELSGSDRQLADRYPPKWLATRLFEDDHDIMGRIADKDLLRQVSEMRTDFENEQSDPPEIRIAETRYSWISSLCAGAARITPEAAAREDISDRIDSVVLNRVAGLPIFLLLMYLMFQLVFTLGEPPMEWIEDGFASLGAYVAQLWPKSAESPLRDLLVEGVIGGVGGVLVFLPNIILLFLAIAFLEGSGYMARAAFIMDRLMNRIGLHGKSFIPMLLGFGCTVPAIMGTRTLENRRDRLATILVLPFMSCGARLPIYALIIPAFFPGYLQAWMVWIIYIIGIIFAIIGAKLLRSTLFKGEPAPFVMELPPYRVPTLRAVIMLMWDRAGEYLKKAGTIILAVSVLLWAMTSYPKKEDLDRDYEAEREAVQEGYYADITEMAERAGIASLTAWAGLAAERDEGEDEFWPHEPGYAAVVAGYETGAQELTASEGGERLSAFIEAVEAIDEINEAFAEATEDLEEDGQEYAEAEAERDAAIASLDVDPDLRESALAYIERRGEYREELAELDNAEDGEHLAYSISGRIGRFVEPVIKPLGFDWRIGTAIIGSFAAKEVFVAQMGIVYSVGEADEDSDTLREKLRENYTPLQGFCMMLYALLSMPCVATIAVAKRETGGWRYAIGMLVGLTVVAYVVTFIVYQAGSALGIGT